MSSVITKLVLTAALGAVLAIATYFITKPNDNERYEYTYNTNRRGPRRRPPPRIDDDDDEDYVDLRFVKDVVDEASSSNRTSAEDELRSSQKCIICFESFENLKKLGKEIHSTFCGHVFCKDCIKSSLARNPECPVCRVPCRGTHRLFL